MPWQLLSLSLYLSSLLSLNSRRCEIIVNQKFQNKTLVFLEYLSALVLSFFLSPPNKFPNFVIDFKFKFDLCSYLYFTQCYLFLNRVNFSRVKFMILCVDQSKRRYSKGIWLAIGVAIWGHESQLFSGIKRMIHPLLIPVYHKNSYNFSHLLSVQCMRHLFDEWKFFDSENSILFWIRLLTSTTQILAIIWPIHQKQNLYILNRISSNIWVKITKFKRWFPLLMWWWWDEDEFQVKCQIKCVWNLPNFFSEMTNVFWIL